MNPQELEQRSDAWYQERAGKVTASRVADVMRTTQKGWSADRKRYMNQLIAERLTERPLLKRVASLEARCALEPEARIAYEFYTDNEVREVGFIPHPTIPNAGASPDGEIDDDGLLQIKCLDADSHIALIKTEIIDNDYLYQCQFELACSERSWNDFFAYHPHMPEQLKAFRHRIYRDEHAIKKIEAAVKDFLAEVDEEVSRLLDRDGQVELKAALA